MTEAEHHQQQLDRQQMIEELAEEANFHIHTAATIPIKERLFTMGIMFSLEKKKGLPT